MVFLITVITAVFLSGWIVRNQEAAYLLDNLHQNSKKTIALLSGASINAVITEDGPMLQSIIEQTARLDPHIFSITIENEDGIILAKWKNHDSQPSFSPGHFQNKLFLKGKLSVKLQ